MPQHIIEGSGAPTTTPEFVGQHYVDTVGKAEYFSVGTSGSSDWILRGSGSGGGSGHAATKVYRTVVHQDDNIANSHGVMLASSDGGHTWSVTGTDDSAAAGATDRIVGEQTNPGFARSAVQSFGLGEGYFIWGGRQYGDTTNGTYVRCTFDGGQNWQALAAEADNSAVSGSTGIDSLAYCSGAWDGVSGASGKYRLLVHDTGTNDYVIKSDDGGSTWARQVITGSLLTSLEAAGGGLVKDHGLWYFDSAWWAATRNTAADEYIEIHKSTDGGATWTLFHTFTPTATYDYYWGSGLGYAAAGATVTSFGVMFVIYATETSSALVFRQVDASTAPTQVLDAKTDLNTKIGGGSTVTSAIPRGRMHGYADHATTPRFFLSLYAGGPNSWLNYYTDDGTTWALGFIAENESMFQNDDSMWYGWDGLAFVFLVQASTTERAYFYTLDGVTVVPHPTLNRSGGDNYPGSHIMQATGGVDRFPALCDA